MPVTESPLRYPGGKTKLIPQVVEIMRENDLFYTSYTEPYAGGAGIAIKLLFDGYVSSIHLNDICVPLYKFWKSVVDRPDELCGKISKTRVSMAEWNRQKIIFDNYTDYSDIDVAFSMFFLNRTNRSGILSGGVIGGKKQLGKWKINARYNKKNLIDKIQRIALYGDKIHLYNEDAYKFLRKTLKGIPYGLVNLDPPYFNKGKELYINYYEMNDHELIAKALDKVKHEWIVTYDNSEEIINLYKRYRSIVYNLNYSANVHSKGSEVIFFKNKMKMPAEQLFDKNIA